MTVPSKAILLLFFLLAFSFLLHADAYSGECPRAVCETPARLRQSPKRWWPFDGGRKQALEIFSLSRASIFSQRRANVIAVRGHQHSFYRQTASITDLPSGNSPRSVKFGMPAGLC